MLGIDHGRRPSSQFPSWPKGALRMAGLFATGDGKYVNLHPGSPGTSIWANFCKGAGRPDFLDEAPYPAGSPEREARGREIERFVRDFFAARSRDEIIAFAAENDVTIAPVQDMADIVRDPQFAHRGALIDVADEELGTLRMVRPTPVLSETPGRVSHAGPAIGANNHEIYQGLLGMSDAELASLHEEGII
jgi:crotonobetainyl-CoA:carnitine CoA-transferase CaiB-like acyl-CoA transferase